MGLVDYSDSEGSDGEHDQRTPAPSTAPPPKFQKAAPGKLQVSLPSLKPEPGQNGDVDADGPPPKRAKTGGRFSGFNALLPAPKKPANAALRKCVNLKTSSEAAFSRNPLPQQTEGDTYTAPDLNDVGAVKAEDKQNEPKLVGKATRFLPLSVSNKKKKKPLPKIPPQESLKTSQNDTNVSSVFSAGVHPVEQEPIKPKYKKSLFSVEVEAEELPAELKSNEYEVATTTRPPLAEQGAAQSTYEHAAPANPNSLEAVAADMNLTAAQKRQLFGRNVKDVNVRHFDLDAQYAENERARQAGEVVEHRAVKAVAPGKHSLQQLVNNAQTQQDALKDKWAEGKRARGEGGSKYGWSAG